jgi:hypothetical protein
MIRCTEMKATSEYEDLSWGDIMSDLTNNVKYV